MIFPARKAALKRGAKPASPSDTALVCTLATQPAPSGTKQQLHWDLCNIVANDWQHWHLGRTRTWTPLRDLELFKLMLRLPQHDAVSQIMNSEISIDIIERNSPGLSQVLSSQKNMHNPLANLAGLVGQ